MPLVWLDVTPYQKGERGEVEASVWETRVGDDRIILRMYRVKEGKKWLLEAPTIGLPADLVTMKSAVFDLVKKEAIQYLHSLSMKRASLLKAAMK